MKAAVLALVRALVGLFYRRIEVSGLENVPREGPVLLIANHNNGLVDPMVVLRALPRPVVFVAKSTLWNIPLLRSLLDLLGCVPVVRKGEGEPGISLNGEERNSAAFERLASELVRGRCVLIFPEGRSHSDPRISELRTGAARVLLLSEEDPRVVPVGLWFDQKEIFRSDVLVKIGAPVPRPADPSVEGWTAALGAALEAVTLNADSWRDLGVIAWWVPYRLCGFVAKRVPGAARERDQIALYKLITGVILFPLALAGWVAVAWTAAAGFRPAADNPAR